MKTKIAMSYEERAPMVPNELEGTIAGAQAFNLKVNKTQKEFEKAISTFNASKADSADETLEKAEAAFKAECAALALERSALMGEVGTKNAVLVMRYFDLEVKALGPAARKHNAAVSKFGAIVHRAMREPQAALGNALKTVGSGGDLAFKRINTANAKCEKMAALFMREYNALLGARDQLNKKTKYVFNMDSGNNTKKVIKI